MASFVDPWGVEVFYDVYPVAHPRAIVLLCHGLGEHAGRYTHVAAALNSAGYAAYAPDLRGHGRTGVKQHDSNPDMLGHLGPGGVAATLDNITQLTEIIRGEHPDVHIVLLGHSMGSIYAQKLINTRAADYAGVVLTGTCYRAPGYMNAGNLNKNFAIPGGTGHEWLSREPEVWKQFAADDWCFKADTLKLFGLNNSLQLFGTPSREMAEVPILMMIGEHDPLGGEKSVLKLANAYTHKAKQTDVTVIVYPGARHEVFNETNRQEVIDDLIAWLTAHLPDAD